MCNVYSTQFEITKSLILDQTIKDKTKLFEGLEFYVHHKNVGIITTRFCKHEKIIVRWKRREGNCVPVR